MAGGGPRCCSRRSQRALRHTVKRTIRSDLSERRKARERSRARSAEPERLFSNLDENLARNPGSLLGMTSLVGGTTVGAGILGLGGEAAKSGFVPFAATTVLIWLYSVVTGLLMAETSVRTLVDKQENSIQTMASRTLGPAGGISSSFLFAFLHYAILIAYSSKGGEVISRQIGLSDTQWVGPVVLNASLGALIYFSGAQQLDRANVLLTASVVATFVGLCISALSNGGIEPENLLARAEWDQVLSIVPVLALSFVFQNIVSVVCTSLEGDKGLIRRSILIGTGIPLLAFLIWVAVLLGKTPPEQQSAGVDPLELLMQSSAPFIAPLTNGFQLSAIATSWIGFFFGLKGLYTDTFNLQSDSRDLRPFALTVVPPTIFAAIKPDIFTNAIQVAGTFGVLTLFGILPPAMSWTDRYTERTNAPLPPEDSQLVPGGKPVLLATGLLAAGVIAQDVLSRVGLLQ